MLTPLLALIACEQPDGHPRRPGPPPEWSDAPVEDLVLARSFTWDDAVRGTVTCAAADDPSEVHTDTGDGGLTLYGLLADTEYDCVLTVRRSSGTRSFRTDPLPDWLPTWTMAVEGDAGGAYTLLNHGTDRRGDRQAKLLIVDPEGRLRWYYSVPYDAPDLDVSWLGDGRFLYGGGYSAPPTIIDLAGRTLAAAPELERGLDYNHDTEMLPTGEVLGLSETPNTDGARTWTGARIDRFDPTLATSTWSWSTQRGVDEGWLPVPAEGQLDPYHTNSMQAAGDRLYVNFRYLSMIARLDAGTGDLVWRLGADGDFALVDADGGPADPSGWFKGPHAPEHDGDRVLFYDNGTPSRGSRALELELDEDAMTARVVWEFTEDGWYESIWGDVDRLPGGNVLVTRAHCARCMPNSDARTQLVEVDPATNEVVWRLVFDDPEDAGYRAERVDGCAIFANERYCPR